MKLATKPMFFAALVLLAVPAAARANEPAPPEAADDVSQINGQPVPVGKHNEYRYEYPRWNVATNPLGWIFGIYGLSVSYAPSEHVALRGDFNHISMNQLDDEAGYELNVGASIYFRRAYQGLFLEPGLMSRRFGGVVVEAGPQVLAGWHWRWDSGLNAALAFGAGRNIGGEDSGSDADLFANGYLRFGYAF